MRIALLALLLLGLAASAAIAVEREGGSLIFTEEYPLGAPVLANPEALSTEYSNVSNFLGQGYANGGATLQGANTITTLVADDITPVGTYGGMDVVQFKFSAVNFNSVAVTFRPRVRFWFADGAGGAPGTYYNLPAPVGYSFNPVTVSAMTVTVFTANISPGQFTMPGSTFWAGITFDDNGGTTGATAAQLDNIGQGIFDPPTTGASADRAFQTQAAGSFFGVNSPAGALFYLGGSPPTNFGWEFTVDVLVPAQQASWGRLKALYR
jgi:hypothetical protein